MSIRFIDYEDTKKTYICILMSPQEYRNEAYRIYEEDMEKAVELFEKAATLKDIPAAVALAAYYYDEECDESAAKDWLEKAFEWWLKMLSRNTLPSGTMTAPPL